MITIFPTQIRLYDNEIRQKYPNCKFLMSIIDDTQEYVYGDLIGISSSPDSFLELCKYKNTLAGDFYIGGDYNIPALINQGLYFDKDEKS